MDRVERLNLLKQHEKVTKEIIDLSYKELELSQKYEMNIEDQDLLALMVNVISRKNDLYIKQKELIKRLY